MSRGESGSRLDLGDSESVTLDDSGRTAAFFARRATVSVDAALIGALAAYAADHNHSSLRVCLHDGPDAALHNMLILLTKGGFAEPHRHPDKAECYHLVEGALAVFCFDDDGAVIERCVLEPGGAFMFRVPPGRFHASVALTDPVVFHESRPGPFTPGGDAERPEWAPDGRDVPIAQAYTQALVARLDRGGQTEGGSR